ncbi:MAG: DUF493 domain-containing protein [Anaerolineales bacterium]|nr:DUF493 domain-containing protein [Anaerolineales bacterium]
MEEESNPGENQIERMTLLEFPCWFPLKAFGRDEEAFEDAVAAIVRKNVSHPEETIVSSKLSREGNFRVVTVRFMAESKAQLDRIYSELNDDPKVLMLL